MNSWTKLIIYSIYKILLIFELINEIIDPEMNVESEWYLILVPYK